MATRADVVDCARSYLGTPWAHMGRTPGLHGELDCLGMIICMMQDLGLCAPDWDIEPYIQTPDGVSMIAGLDRRLTRITQAAMQPGDAVCLIQDKHPQHLGILATHPAYGVPSLIHASNGVRPARVVETQLVFARNLKFVACYGLPGVT